MPQGTFADAGGMVRVVLGTDDDALGHGPAGC